METRIMIPPQPPTLWFCRVESEDGLWRVVTQKHKLEKFRLQSSDDGLRALIEEVRTGLTTGRLISITTSQA